MPIGALKATAQIGYLSENLSIPLEANRVEITMGLKKGTYDLKTTFLPRSIQMN